jgi:hypothetical protein
LHDHLSRQALNAGLPAIQAAPTDQGELRVIVRRPANNERESLSEGFLSKEEGLVGDNWRSKGKADTDMQLNVMNFRVAELVAQSPQRIPLAGDQLYVDLDLSEDNLPIGTRLTIGEAEIEITAQPHLGCMKFVERFGRPAMEFVNSALGKSLKLRGINAKVTREGAVRIGDKASKVA